VTRELDCQPDCHQDLRWKTCSDMRCREIDLGEIAEHALLILGQIEDARENG